MKYCIIALMTLVSAESFAGKRTTCDGGVSEGGKACQHRAGDTQGCYVGTCGKNLLYENVVYSVPCPTPCTEANLNLSGWAPQ